MKLTEEDIEFDWEMWGEAKPWYCSECDTLLAKDEYTQCNGTDPEMPEENWKPHNLVVAAEPVTFEEFKTIQLRWASKHQTENDLPEE